MTRPDWGWGGGTREPPMPPPWLRYWLLVVVATVRFLGGPTTQTSARLRGRSLAVSASYT